MSHSYTSDSADNAGISTFVLPDLPYQPPVPRGKSRGIGLIGAGAITESHLAAYQKAGFDLRIIYDPNRANAIARRDAFFPDARIADTLDQVWADDRVEVVDIATHPGPRAALIEAALMQGRHVLSQKPFVLDLDTGARLVDLADSKGLKLAVNQNGRWAPHLSWMREACRNGLIGQIESVHCAMHWDHNWTAGTPFDQIPDLILYDFGIHWFDFLASLVGPSITTVRASKVKSQSQVATPPLFAQVQVDFDGGQASLVFDGGARFGPEDTTYIGGSDGSLSSRGPSLEQQTITATTSKGAASPALQGTWFQEGFLGTMSELLCAIDDNREPENSARGNLQSLALCFAAIEASRTGLPVKVGAVRALSEG